jgi:hypothetical protein
VDWKKLIGKTITDVNYDAASQALTIILDGEEELEIKAKMELGAGEFYAPTLCFQKMDVANLPV